MYFNVVPFHLAAPVLYPPISGAEIFVYDCRYFVARELLRFSKEFLDQALPFRGQRINIPADTRLLLLRLVSIEIFKHA